jgi:minor curlin subunit
MAAQSLQNQTEIPGSPSTIQVVQYTRSINQHRASGNSTTIPQDTTAVGEHATIQQYGTANMGYIEQYSNANTSTMDQPGNSNAAIIDQSGASNFAQISHTGTRNSAMVTQH